MDILFVVKTLMCLKRRKEIKKRPGLAQFLKKETGLENINLATENGKNTTVCKRLDKSVPVSSMQTVQGSHKAISPLMLSKILSLDYHGQ